MKFYEAVLRVTLAIVAVLVWLPSCRCGTFHANESELVDEGDYFDGDEEDRLTEAETQKRQHLLQRSPQHQQQQLQPLYSSLLVPNANVQPNPLRLPNVLNLPPGAPARWVQPMGNGLPANPNLLANPNLPAGGQRYVLMPFTTLTTPPPATTKSASSQQQPPQSQTTRLSPSATPPAVDPTVGRPWELPPGPAPLGALPGAPLTGNAAQRLIVLPSGSKPSTTVGDNSKLQRQQSVQQAAVPTVERPTYPQVVTPTVLPSEKPTLSVAAIPSAKTTSATAVQPQTAQVVRIQPTSQAEQPKQQMPSLISQQVAVHVNETGPSPIDELDSKGKSSGRAGRPIGVHTTHGRLLLEPYAENYCDIRQYSDEQLLSKNLQRVEYFVANLTCSRYFFECAIGQTFLLNCTSKDQVFDINTVNCNFKYNVKSCNEYDHILHCSIREECQEEQFACCTEPQQCIPYTKRCDGVADCNDGEDENNCPSCGVDEFPCVKSGKCISWDKRCNGIPDECFDQTNLDEQNCGGCPPEKFTCGRSSESGSQTCIDVSLRCNGIRDCPRGEDELNCKSKGQKYLLCENQKQSVSKEQWCDGYEDCLDGSDEKYCVY